MTYYEALREVKVGDTRIIAERRKNKDAKAWEYYIHVRGRTGSAIILTARTTWRRKFNEIVKYEKEKLR